MRHRGWVDVAALLLMAGGAWLIWDIRNDTFLSDALAARADRFGLDLGPYLWATVAAAAALGVASVAMLVTARVPHLARSSPRFAAVLVLVGTAAAATPWVRILTVDDAWSAGTRTVTLLQPVTGLLCTVALGGGIAIALLGRGSSAPAATGAVVLWGVLTAVVILRDGLERESMPTVGLAFVDRVWVVGGTGLLVVAAGLLITAWCAGPPAGRDRVLARCRGGYAAVALLLPQVTAIDVALTTIDFDGVDGPDDWWLLLRGGLVLGTALAAAGAALFKAATPVLAVVAPALGIAAAVMNHLPGVNSLYVAIVGSYPLLVAAIAPAILGAFVAYAYRRLPADRTPEPEAPEVQPVA